MATDLPLRGAMREAAGKLRLCQLITKLEPISEKEHEEALSQQSEYLNASWTRLRPKENYTVDLGLDYFEGTLTAIVEVARLDDNSDFLYFKASQACI